MIRNTFAIAAVFLHHAHARCDSATDCSSCTNDPSCFWWEEFAYCEKGCGMNGCGASKCASDIDNCWDCLGDGYSQPAAGQYAWSPSSGSNGECVGSCMEAPADASCYPGKNPDNGFNGYDSSICYEIVEPSTCADCLRDPNSYWWEDIGYCEKGCGMNGCGAYVCASDIDNCWDCLGGEGTPASGQYAWSPSSGENGECVASCMGAPADASCYPAKNFANGFQGYDPSICYDIAPPPESECQSIGSNCKKCLKRDCAWSVGECHDDCMSAPADASCYQGQNAKRDRDTICSDEEVAFA
mmetsp:Transcript_9318/g.20376  ORF Transcript_9318/g.20376 Transcript_9318/m.20376 type:complete len:299 (-) Transcript_9318:2488-3384(-)